MAADQYAVVEITAAALPNASGRVVLSVREHFGNRAELWGADRIFVNQSGRGKVVEDERRELDPALLEHLIGLLDNEIQPRLPITGRVVVDQDSSGWRCPSQARPRQADSGCCRVVR
jgi:hypothetical protein